MILRIWHLSDAATNYLGSPYLHREVEDWIGTQIDGIPEEEWEAPDLAVTDPAGLTTFVAAFGLDRISTVDVQGMGRLAEYPGELVFVGLAQKMVFVEQVDHMHVETETTIDPATGIATVRPILPELVQPVWKDPKTELRLRGLIVDKTTQRQTELYVESRVRPMKDGKVDLVL